MIRCGRKFISLIKFCINVVDVCVCVCVCENKNRITGKNWQNLYKIKLVEITEPTNSKKECTTSWGGGKGVHSTYQGADAGVRGCD